MPNLGSYQKLINVVGNNFGSGKDGAATISSDPNTRATLTGTINLYTATIGSAILSNNDLVMCHQTQGTGAGQWQWNRVLSGGGTTSITWFRPNQFAYVTGAQVIRVPQNTTATITTHSTTAWNGTTGGVEVIVAKSITLSSALTATAGFRGGAGVGPGDIQGKQGESYNDNSQGSSTSANENGGGGGAPFSGSVGTGGGGGGGGHSSTGTTGTAGNGGETPGTAGTVSTDSSDGVLLQFGGAGGSGGDRNVNSATTVTGGTGGGIVVLVANSITLSSSLSANGQQPAQPSIGGAAGSGGGAGGFILMLCKTATLGTGNATATAGSGGLANGGNGNGGAGSAGYIAIHHSGTITGTTSPTFNDITDNSLQESGALLFTSGL